MSLTILFIIRVLRGVSPCNFRLETRDGFAAHKEENTRTHALTHTETHTRTRAHKQP